MTTADRPLTNPQISRSTLVLVSIVGGAFALLLVAIMCFQQSSPFPQHRVGGDFTLVDTDGRPVGAADLRGKPTVVYFGFTFCPEVCPTTLNQLSVALRKMGRVAERPNVVFVSVDPARDTPDQMKLYLSSFDPHIRGFTGTEAQVAEAAKAYHVR